MIIEATAPARLSLFGGGTDLPIYFENEHPGMVLSMAINLYHHLKIYTEKEVFEHNFKNTFPDGANPEFYYTIFKQMGYDGGHRIKIDHSFDGKIQGGLGSSAGIACALVTAINRQKGVHMTREEVAEKAWDIEVNKLHLYGGKQDQYAASFGGLNIMYFNKDKITVDPLPRDRADTLVKSILLFHTGITRKDPHIQEELVSLTPSQIERLNDIYYMAEYAIGPVWMLNMGKVGYLLNESWKAKKALNPKATTPEIDLIYDTALKSGAIGGKLCGSGGGGYTFFICEPSKQSQVTDALVSLGCIPVDFDVDWNGTTTRIL